MANVLRIGMVPSALEAESGLHLSFCPNSENVYSA